MEQIPRGRHGRWYTREGDDPIDQTPDRDASTPAAVDVSQARDDAEPSE